MNRLARQLAVLSAFAIVTAASAETVTRVAILTGSQEVPANASPARGGARFVIDTDANTAIFEIVHWGLGSAETAAHIHGTSAPGVNAGVIFPLPSGTVKRGTWNFTEAQQAPLLNGLMYINVHTMGFPGGEIRGQIVSAVADLDGIQEVPSNGSGGGGVGLFNLDPVTDQLTYYIIFGGLGSAEAAAHIHGFAQHGVNAGVVHPLPAGSPKTGTWNYPAAQEQAILDGMTYVNIHSAGFPGGEIRGQIVSWVNTLCGLQEVPPTPSTSAGVTLATLNRTTNTLTSDTRYSGFATAESGAHIHGFADVGVNAGVLTALPAGLRKFNVWAFGAASFNNVFTSRSYVNIHSAAFGGGEIRGQLFRGTSIPCTPLITDQPDGTTVDAPTAITLMVVADARNGGPLSYQWKRNGVNVPAAAPFFGSLTDTLSINPTDPAFSGLYTCLVTNLCGSTLTAAANVLIEVPCDGDVNCDFALDGFDVETQEKAVGGDLTDYCQPDPDFNGDFALDGFDVEAVEIVTGGGPCP